MVSVDPGRYRTGFQRGGVWTIAGAGADALERRRPGERLDATRRRRLVSARHDGRSRDPAAEHSEDRSKARELREIPADVRDRDRGRADDARVAARGGARRRHGLADRDGKSRARSRRWTVRSDWERVA